MDTVTLTRDKLFKMNISNTGVSATSLSAPLRTPAVTPAPLPFAQNAWGQEQKGPEWIKDNNKERSKLMDGIRSDREKRKNDKGDRAPKGHGPGTKTTWSAICVRARATTQLIAQPQHQTQDLHPRSPPETETEDPEGCQETGTGGHQRTGGLPGMEIEGKHLMDQGIPVWVALTDTTTTILGITVMTAPVMSKRMKDKCSFLGYPLRTC